MSLGTIKECVGERLCVYVCLINMPTSLSTQSHHTKSPHWPPPRTSTSYGPITQIKVTIDDFSANNGTIDNLYAINAVTWPIWQKACQLLATFSYKIVGNAAQETVNQALIFPRQTELQFRESEADRKSFWMLVVIALQSSDCPPFNS